MREDFNDTWADLRQGRRRSVERADCGQHEQDDVVVVGVVVATGNVRGVRRTRMSQRAETASATRETSTQTLRHITVAVYASGVTCDR